MYIYTIEIFVKNVRTEKGCILLRLFLDDKKTKRNSVYFAENHIGIITIGNDWFWFSEYQKAKNFKGKTRNSVGKMHLMVKEFIQKSNSWFNWK